jgi:predicted nucleic acid-binding protein
MARQLGLHVTGVLGALLRGKRMGHLEAIKPEIDALRAKAHFFIAPDLERAILSHAAE